MLPEVEKQPEVVSQVLDALKTKVSEFNYNNWFRHSQWLLEDENRVTIQVPSKFIRDWISENYLEVIKFELFKLTGWEHQVYFKIGQTASLTKAAPPQSPPAVERRPQTPTPKVSQHQGHPGLKQRYSFKNFIVGNSNQFVYAACQAVVTQPAKNYNPLFIYGGVGLGKTHLINALGLEVRQKNPSLKVIYATGEEFTNEVINSIRYGKTLELRNKYRTNCDLLLIDDVQFLAGKERTMEEFFHTFNALYEARKQIVMTSDTLPKDISNLEERLRSRFSWGLLADIQPPELETRMAILREKAEAEQLALSDEVCHYLASHIKTNVRDLEGCLIRVSAFASLASVPITIQLAREVLKNVLAGFTATPTIESIQNTVASYFQLRINDLKSPRRHKNLAVPRHIAMYLCKKHVKASFPEIGHKFGGKDHTTVIHAVRKIGKCLDADTLLRDRVGELEKIITQNV